MGSISDAVDRQSVWEEGYKTAEKDALKLIASILEVTGPVVITRKAQIDADPREVEWIERGYDMSTEIRLRKRDG